MALKEKKMMNMRERLRQKVSEGDSNTNSGLVLREDVPFFKAKKGKNKIIIVPFEMTGPNLEGIPEGEMWFRFQVLKHFGIGPEKQSVICPKTVGKRCPICEYRASLISQGKQRNEEEVQALLPKKREYYNVIDVDHDEDSVKIWEVSHFNFGKRLREEIEDAEDQELAMGFADPDDGALLIVKMTEESMGSNKYLEASRIDFVERDPINKTLLESVVHFDQCVHVRSFKEIQAMLLDLDEATLEAEGEEPEEETRRPSRPMKKEPKKEKELEAESEEEPEEEKEGRRRPRRRKVEPEPEQEEEAPKKARRKAEPEPEPEEEEEPESRPMIKEPAMKKKAPAASREHKCPFGGVFGEDCDTEEMTDKCENCSIWIECKDAADTLDAAAE